MLARIVNIFILQVPIYLALEEGKLDTKLNMRIVGGVDADITEFPYQASLQDKYGHMCGCSILSSTWVITAAHCVDGVTPSLRSVCVGSTASQCAGQLLRVKRIITHEKYDFETNDYDIALLELDTELSTRNTRPIKLPALAPGPPEDAIAVVTGWGYLSEKSVVTGKAAEHLQKLEVPLVDIEICRKNYVELYVSERMFCAGFLDGGKDACQGDSGGPLVINGTLYGIVSSGIGCARPGYPGIYTNVALLREWIQCKMS